jgi:hypothetical protein
LDDAIKREGGAETAWWEARPETRRELKSAACKEDILMVFML